MLRLQPLAALEDNYIWLLADPEGNALVVDPGESDPVEVALRDQALRLAGILITHHHPDHTGGVRALKQRHACRVIGPHDERITADERVADGDRVEFESPRISFNVIEVPGHTRSHVAFHADDMLFCGDTLFSLGCGRLFEGTPTQMLTSLDRLAVLPGSTRVYCGHEYTLANARFAASVDGDNPDLARYTAQSRARRDNGEPTLPSTLDIERASNPFLRIDTPALKTWAASQGAGSARSERFAALREAKDQFQA